MIGGRERGERHLVVPGLSQATRYRGDNLVCRALAHRAVRDARLAESATAGAAAQNLDRQAVMNQLGIRNDRLTQRVGSAKVLDHALIYDFGNILPLTRDRIPVLRAGSSYLIS